MIGGSRTFLTRLSFFISSKTIHILGNYNLIFFLLINNIFVIIYSMNWNIEFYETENGNSPVIKFIDSLSSKEKAKIARYFDLLSEYGNFLREPYVKPIHGYKKLLELRIPISPNICRIFYFQWQGSTFVMLHAFIKKTNKTPKKELELAEKRMKDYQRRFDL
jgi:phage-related protein